VDVGQYDARFSLVTLQGRLEKRLETSGSWLVSHLMTGAEMGYVGGVVGSLVGKIAERCDGQRKLR
jgi:hypothetical protein